MDLQQVGLHILKVLGQGPSIEASLSEKSTPISSPTVLSPRKSSSPFHTNTNRYVIQAGLYPMELTGGVPLPSDVDPEITANFKANQGPHIRCLTPYLTLPPSPNSHPWLYTQKEIEDYNAKMKVCLPGTEGAPPPVIEGETLTENENPTEIVVPISPKTTQGRNKNRNSDNNSSDSDDRLKKIPKNNTPTPRKSRRIKDKPPRKTYSPNKTRQRRSGKEPTIPSAATVLVLVAQVTVALELEAIKVTPLEEGVIAEVNRFCGTHINSHLIPKIGAASQEEIRKTMAVDYNMDEESIIKSLEYDPYEDAFTDEEELEEEPMDEGANDQGAADLGEQEMDEEEDEEPEDDTLVSKE